MTSLTKQRLLELINFNEGKERLIFVFSIVISCFLVSLLFDLLLISDDQVGILISLVLMIYGFISGYIGNEFYLKTFLRTIMIIFLLIIIIGMISALTGYGFLGLEHNHFNDADPLRILFFSLLYLPFISALFSTIFAVILLPALLIGASSKKKNN